MCNVNCYSQVEAVFELNDADHDGRLTREEFHEFMNHPQGDSAKKEKE